jgi:hypothetical protein
MYRQEKSSHFLRLYLGDRLRNAGFDNNNHLPALRRQVNDFLYPLWLIGFILLQFYQISWKIPYNLKINVFVTLSSHINQKDSSGGRGLQLHQQG